MKKNIALLLSLTLGLTATVCAIPASETMAESSKELIVSTGTEAVTMYRLYNPNSGEHFYTKDESEKAGLVEKGWNDEGIGWIAPVTSKTPVYRLYNANAGDHHYTLKEEEKDNLISAGWNFEGIGWYSDDEKAVPLYREYNPNAVTGTHNYTTDKAEHDGLVAAGWHDEGIGWYAIGDGKNDPPKKPDDDSLEIGDIVILGTYEQDNDLTNGPEPIEWQYIADRDGHKYLLSKYVLDCEKYNSENADITWEECSLRKWLNEDFYNTAFSAEDKKRIATAHNENPDSYKWWEGLTEVPCGAKGGNDTDDNVFLMSVPEAQEYLDGKIVAGPFESYLDKLEVDRNRKLMCRPTAYAVGQGAYAYPNEDDDGLKYPPDAVGCSWWWLRSPGGAQISAAVVMSLGSKMGGQWAHVDDGVRPAILID